MPNHTAFDSAPQGAPQTNFETPHHYTIQEIELCLSAVLSYLAQMDVFIVTHKPSHAPAFYEVRHGMGKAKSWSFHDTRHEAYSHALIKAQALAAQQEGGA